MLGCPWSTTAAHLVRGPDHRRSRSCSPARRQNFAAGSLQLGVASIDRVGIGRPRQPTRVGIRAQEFAAVARCSAIALRSVRDSASTE